MAKHVPMSSPDLTEAELAAVREVLTTRHLAVGARTESFERRLAVWLGSRHAVAVSSGTAGLHLCVVAAGLGRGDLAITTPFSFIASANCLLYEDAVPVFVDVQPATGNIDPALVEQAAHDIRAQRPGWPRWLPPSLRADPPSPAALKALLPIHAFGQPADMRALNGVAARHQLVVIEDACEALGTEQAGRKTGTFGRAGVFGFYPNKQITTGEGGMIVTDDDEWALLFRSLRNQGRDVFDSWLTHSRLGYNYRLDEMSAAIGLVQMERIEEILLRRERVAEWYGQRLRDLEGVEPPHVAPTTTRASWFVYVVRFGAGIDRAAVMAALDERGVPTRPYFTPIHLQPLYVQRFGYAPGDFPVAEDLGSRSLALPFSSVMEEDQVEHVTAQLRTVLSQSSHPSHDRVSVGMPVSEMPFVTATSTLGTGSTDRRDPSDVGVLARYPLARLALRFHHAIGGGLHLGLVVLANLIAFWLRFDGDVPPEWQAIQSTTLPWLVGVRCLMFWPLGLYEGLWRYTGIWDLKNIITGVGSSSVLAAVLFRLGFNIPYPRSIYVIDAMVLIMLMTGVRLSRRVYIEVARHQGRKRLLIFGAGDTGERIVRRLRNGDGRDYEPIGFIDDDLTKVGLRIHGVPVLGTLANAGAIVGQRKPAEVLVAIPNADPERIRAVVRSFERLKVPVKTVPKMDALL